MDEQLKDLMKRANEAHAKQQQRNRDQNFFAWLEKKIGIDTYTKVRVGNTIGADLDNLAFYNCCEAEEFSTVVFADCRLCQDGKPFRVGVIKNIEELGKFIKKDAEGNFYFRCNEHIYIDEQNQTIEEAQLMFAEQDESVKPKTTGKRQYVMTYFSDKNYDSFEKMSIETRSYIRKKIGIKLKQTHLAEMAIMIACDIFNEDKKTFLSLVDSQVEKSDL